MNENCINNGCLKAIQCIYKTTTRNDNALIMNSLHALGRALLRVEKPHDLPNMIKHNNKSIIARYESV